MKYIPRPDDATTPELSVPPSITPHTDGSGAASNVSMTVESRPGAAAQELFAVGCAVESHTHVPAMHDPIPLHPSGHPLPIYRLLIAHDVAAPVARCAMMRYRRPGNPALDGSGSVMRVHCGWPQKFDT